MMQHMKDLDVGIDCTILDKDFDSAAANMDDLADIIQDIGMINLKNQLGLDLDFSLTGQY